MQERHARTTPAVISLDVVANERADDIVERLRERGGRMTRPRRLVINALLSGPGHHMTASDIVAAVRADDPEFYESTVYRTLDRLLELGVVERVQLGPGGAVFHLPHRPHHHLVCERCGNVIEIPAAVLDDLSTRIRAEHGFRLRPSASTLVGSCARCDAAVETPS
jgi:Fur family ferric uptake transcriptional regulator